jgi:hypothetical protein
MRIWNTLLGAAAALALQCPLDATYAQAYPNRVVALLNMAEVLACFDP